MTTPSLPSAEEAAEKAFDAVEGLTIDTDYQRLVWIDLVSPIISAVLEARDREWCQAIGFKPTNDNVSPPPMTPETGAAVLDQARQEEVDEAAVAGAICALKEDL